MAKNRELKTPNRDLGFQGSKSLETSNDLIPTKMMLGQKTPEGGSKLKRIGEILRGVGGGMQDIQAGVWSMDPGPMGQAARAYKAAKAAKIPKALDPTNESQNYQAYLKDEADRGNLNPMSFFEWGQSRRKAGASGGGETPMTPQELKMYGQLTNFLGRIFGGLSDTDVEPNPETSPGLTKPEGLTVRRRS